MFSKARQELQDYKTFQVFTTASTPKNYSRLEKETFELLKQLLVLIKEKFNLQEDANTDYVHAQFTNACYDEVEILFLNSSCDYRDTKVDKQNKPPIAFLKTFNPCLSKKNHPSFVGWSYTVVGLDSKKLVDLLIALEKLPAPLKEDLEGDNLHLTKLFNT